MKYLYKATRIKPRCQFVIDLVTTHIMKELNMII